MPYILTSHQLSAYYALLREIQQCLCSSSKNVNAGAQRMKMLTGLLRLRQVCCDLRLLKVAQASSLHSPPERKLEARATLLAGHV